MNKLGRLIRENGLTISRVSRATGIGRAYLSHLANGRRTNPSPRIVEALCRFFNKSPRDIFPRYGR